VSVQKENSRQARKVRQDLSDYYKAWEWIGLKISARNRLEGVIEHIEKGPVTSKIKIKINKPVTVTAVITKEAVDDLKLSTGDIVEAVIKSTEVMISKE